MIISNSLIWEETTLKKTWRKLQFMLFYAVKLTLEVIGSNLHKFMVSEWLYFHSSPAFSSWYQQIFCSSNLYYFVSWVVISWFRFSRKRLPWNTNSPPSLPIFITDNRTRIDPNPGPTNRAIQNPSKPRIHTFHMKKVSTIRQFPTKIPILKSLQANRTIPNRLLRPTITHTRQIKRGGWGRRRSVVVTATAMTAVEGGGCD